jgi:predicted cupin superfamily sugar epimerase
MFPPEGALWNLEITLKERRRLIKMGVNAPACSGYSPAVVKLRPGVVPPQLAHRPQKLSKMVQITRCLNLTAKPMNPHTESLIKKLALLPHPEGGYYRETYRAPLQVQSPEHDGPRSAFTSILFLLGGGQYSAWHRVASDESWFFHEGSDVEIYSLLPLGSGDAAVVRRQTLGLVSGCFELTIPAGTWFAARPVQPDTHALVSCVVAPGFEFEDFELASKDQLIEAGYDATEHWSMIESLLVARST